MGSPLETHAFNPLSGVPVVLPVGHGGCTRGECAARESSPQCGQGSRSAKCTGGPQGLDCCAGKEAACVAQGTESQVRECAREGDESISRATEEDEMCFYAEFDSEEAGACTVEC